MQAFSKLQTLRAPLLGAPTRIAQALMVLLAGCAGSPAFAQSAEAPNLPANLRPLIPRGWVATSFAEVDMNKDGTMDRAVLLAPDGSGGDGVSSVAGTPLTDRCRNLLVVESGPNGPSAKAHYLPWSSQIGFQSPGFFGADERERCLASPPSRASSSRSPRGVQDRLFRVNNSLRYEWTIRGEAKETIVVRIEGDCVRLIGSEFEEQFGAQRCETRSSSRNYLTRLRIDTYTSKCPGWDGLQQQTGGDRPGKSTMPPTPPICLPETVLDMNGESVAPNQPAVASHANSQQPAETPPAPQATTQRRPTATADNPYLPPNPLLPRTECLTPPMPMLEHYNRRDSGFGEQLMGSCDGEYDADVCTGVAHTMTFGDILRSSIGDAEYEDTVIWGVDDCGLWLRDANYVDAPTVGWAPEQARRGRYYVVPIGRDGSYFLERWGEPGQGFRFTPLPGNFLSVRYLH